MSKRKYARLLVDRAVNIQPGQMLYVEAPIAAADFVVMLAEEAFSAGASDVRLRWVCSGLDRLKAEYGAFDQGANEADAFAIDKLIEAGAAYLRLDSPDTEAFLGVSAEKLQRKAAFERAIRLPFRAKGKAQNSIATVPTPAWARAVFPELSPDAALERLWDCVLDCTASNLEDPEAFWDDNYQKTLQRRNAMEAKHFSALHLTAPGTDITIGLPEAQQWSGGAVESGGVRFIPNLPTYEVFTTPHKYRINGVVAATLPLNYSGGMISGFSLTFRDGKAVDFSAEEGGELLQSILEHDAGSCYAGEIAIVSGSSPVARQGRVFRTTLLDENAACHIALGSGFASADSDEEADRLGYNRAGLHVDFMVGSPEMDITGLYPDGSSEPVMRAGEWCF